MIGGLCATAVDLRDRVTNTHVIVFIRDNMFRLLSELDSDFSRNLAGDNIRLTWDHATFCDLEEGALACPTPANDKVVRRTSLKQLEVSRRDERHRQHGPIRLGPGGTEGEVNC